MEPLNEPTTPKKTKRLTSVVWDHFERIKTPEGCYARCNHCYKSFSGSSNSGTTHLRNHMKQCLKNSDIDVSELLSSKKKRTESPHSISNVSFDVGHRKEDYIKTAIVRLDQDQKRDELLNLGSGKFDQDRSQLDLARMIILHGYPLTIVDHVGFKVFVKNLQPLFDIVPDSSLELSCMEIYGKEKQRLYDAMHKLPGRINIAVEMWNSAENAEYLSLIAYYIDNDWKLHKKILNFVTLDPYQTQDMLSEVIVKCLMDWSIDYKLFAITFDDFSAEEGIVLKIRYQISQNRTLLSNDELSDVRCALHILHSIVQDPLEALRDVTQKIRASVRYIKSSQSTQEKFNQIAQQVGVNNQRGLVLDCPNKWMSTFRMLEIVIEYRGAFSRLQEYDSAYSSTLTDVEWEWTSSVTGYLGHLVEIINDLSGNPCPTANIYFPEICDVHIKLIEWCKSPDDFISSMASKMKAKFDNYWNRCSSALAIAAILDPRYKTKLMEYYYSQIYGSTALERIQEVSGSIKRLYSAYSPCSTSVDNGSAFPGSSSSNSAVNTRDRLVGFDRFLHETYQSQGAVSDLDKYLEEPVFPRNSDFSILNWWKVHTPRYPILSMMARDVLATPMSNVAADSAFSMGGRVLDPYRSSLNPSIRQALICAQDWLRSESGENNPSSSHSPLSAYVESN